MRKDSALKLFQLPRIAKPSGTSSGPGRCCRGWGDVSTSPDSKAIRNLAALVAKQSWFVMFQLPRTARPSGTGSLADDHAIRYRVSTSPDSKAIRNRAKGCRLGGAGLLLVSTSPDSKAIRNTPRRGIIVGSTNRFQLPRIAKPSGTGGRRWLKRSATSFNFPG